jgi:hypothetical protein
VPVLRHPVVLRRQSCHGQGGGLLLLLFLQLMLAAHLQQPLQHRTHALSDANTLLDDPHRRACGPQALRRAPAPDAAPPAAPTLREEMQSGLNKGMVACPALFAAGSSTLNAWRHERHSTSWRAPPPSRL